MKKIIIFIFLILLIKQNSNSQQWELSTWSNNPSNIAIGSADVMYYAHGYEFPAGYNMAIWKTTNKGATWELSSGALGSGNALVYRGLFFINANTGWFSYLDDGNESEIWKTTTGGSYWQRIMYSTGTPFYGAIKFIDGNTGYLWKGPPFDNKLYKTTDGGSAWAVVYQTSAADKLITDVEISKLNSNNIYVCGYRFDPNNNINLPIFVKTTNGFSNYQTISDGSGDPWLVGGINSISSVVNNNSDLVKFGGTKGVGVLNSDNTLSIISQPYSGNAVVNYLTITNANHLAAGITDPNDGDKLMESTNNGLSWSFVGSLTTADHLKPISSIGNIVCEPIRNDNGLHKLAYRNLSINFNANRDWQGNYSGTILINNYDGYAIREITTPAFNQYLRGGSAELSIPDDKRYIVSGSDSIARFYYWGGTHGNGSMNWFNNYIYYINDGDINADYKSLLKSTTSGALLNANQVKAIKDTNGVINFLYESLEGIFFTRTKPGGQFKAEEIVSGISPGFPTGFVTWKNTNPYLCEIKPPHGGLILDPEKNMAACWEQRVNNDIKILYAERTWSTELQAYVWYNYELLTLSNAMPLEFKCNPKIVVMKFGNNEETKVLTFLKPVPNSSNKRLIGKVLYKNNPLQTEYDLTTEGDIQEYAIAPIANDGENGSAMFNIHFSYRKGQNIYYKMDKIGWDENLNEPRHVTLLNEFLVSTESSRYRSSLDIALKNVYTWYGMQPVITYQARVDTRIIINRDFQAPLVIDGTNYPIHVWHKDQAGWHDISYTAPNKVQQNPVIDGSKLDNSCLLNYKSGNQEQIRVPRWLGRNVTTTLNYFNAQDARLVKGSIISGNNYGNNYDYYIMKLNEQQNNTYSIEKLTFQVIDAVPGSEFDQLRGVVVYDNNLYSFNLGYIMINWNLQGMYDNYEGEIEDNQQMNENMRSRTFYLNDYDTLVIGRNGFFIPADLGTAHDIEYRVNLINNSTGMVHAELAHDTIHVNDTIEVEFLEGFVIDNIPNGSDSFYVQLAVDTLFQGDDYGIGSNVITENNENNSPSSIKNRVFWRGVNYHPKTNNLPTVFNLYQNFPNPFNPVTKIKYDLPKNVNVTVKIYDLLGREVTNLVNNEYKNAGRYELEWNAQNYASGVYVYRINAGNYVNVKKMILLK